VRKLSCSRDVVAGTTVLVSTAEQDRSTISAFARQLEVVADPGIPGRYLIDLDPRWNCPIVPQGGTMTAVTAAAMAAEIGDPRQRLRTITTVFAAQVPAGPVAVDVTVLRQGRRATQAVATTRAAGADVGHTSVAVFGPDGAGFEFTDLAMPDAPDPAACRSFREPPPAEFADAFANRPPMPFWDHVEGRPALGHAPWEDYVPAASDCAFWYRFDEPPFRPDGTLEPLAAVALCDLMPSSVHERMGPDQPEWYPPSADLTVHLFGEPRSEWLLGHLRARRASAGFASVETALWDPTDRSLVAHGSQVMYLVFPDGTPEGEARVPPDRRPS
jgi:acyl-CoA thioesterase